jgi:translation initiation factor IF-3
VDLLQNVKEGESVKIGINIRGREWTNPQGEVKYFNSITGWRLEKVSGDAPQGNFTEKPKEKAENPFAEVDDDLPF